MHQLTRHLLLLLLYLLVFAVVTSAQSKKSTTETMQARATPRITFVELGSVKCIPCRMMQPIMKRIETRYGDQVKVVFYDVWKEDQKQYARDYGIRVIPTQVFLDTTGKEVFRHEGFFPESEIDALLAKHGLKAAS